MDVVDAATRSRIMSRIRGRDTKPELRLRSALFAAGARFRVHDRTIPGTPDISHKGAKVAVFVDGCFWHGCPQHYTRPQSRQDYWDGRLAYNRQHRQRVKGRLDGWHVIEAWECQIRDAPTIIAEAVLAAIEARRPALATKAAK